MKGLPAAAAVLALLAGCAEPPSVTQVGTAGPDCFSADQVSGFTETAGSAIRVSPSVGRTYELALTGPGCDDVGWAHAIAIDPSPSATLCTGERPGQGRVLFRSGGSDRVVRCQISDVQRVEAPRITPPA